MRNTVARYQHLANILLFSGMGCFSYLFLVINTDFPLRAQADLISPWPFAAVVLAFNTIGFSLMRISRWLIRDDMTLPAGKKKQVVALSGIALLLLLMNYLLLVTVKWSIDMPQPWYFRRSGIWILAIIWLVEMVVLSLTLANNIYRHVIRLYRKNTRLEESTLKARYQALQSQLNPHFLFNSLNTLISEIRYNPPNAEQFARHLSDVYRYTLQCQEQPLATLRSELDYLDSYLFLHRVRLGDCIRFDNQVEPLLWDRKVPPLALQLLVENVIKHNTIHTGRPMTITLAGSADRATIQIINAVCPKKETLPSGQGLKNLSARYRLICDRDIQIENNPHQFTVKIPLLDE